jgi:hypothetical protein
MEKREVIVGVREVQGKEGFCEIGRWELFQDADYQTSCLTLKSFPCDLPLEKNTISAIEFSA